MRHPARGGARGVAALAALLLAGCADRGGDETVVRTQTVERTRVELLEQPGPGTHFDPEAIYERVSPGVVTVVSTGFSGDSGGGVGSGFVIDAGGEIATNAHVVTTGDGRRRSRRPGRST